MASQPTTASLAFVESLYESYLKDPLSVAAEWRDVFQSWDVPVSSAAAAYALPSGARNMVEAASSAGGAISTAEATTKQHLVDVLIRNFRTLGHLGAHLNPLADGDAELPPELRPELYGFTDADMDNPFIRSATLPGAQVRTLRSVLEQMQMTYCRRIGVQFMHIDDMEVRQWLQNRMESCHNSITLSRNEQLRILSRLADATLFEEFIMKKFVGAKSFSLEGGETMIPLMDLVLEHAGENGLREVVIGMAHRGRLNVLSNVMGKSASKIFREFKDSDPEAAIGGSDVKYHMGYSSDWKTSHGKNVHLSLCFNPSHLEYVNAVALGRVRAKQDVTDLGTHGEHGIALLIHGDAAFAGEGIVQETLQLSNLSGYKTGGTVHVVINNQVGFTTDPVDSRSTHYCTDVARMLQSPIFHVNGEDPEAVAQMVAVAMEFRQKFKRDVFIDMYCFRKRGHNENDEPRYTQPEMYAKIDARKRVLESYRDNLLKLGQVTLADAEAIEKARLEVLEKELAEASADTKIAKPDSLKGAWSGYYGGPERADDEPVTGIPAAKQQEILRKLMELPEGFNLHPTLQRMWKEKAEVAAGNKPMNWGAAEALSIAALALEGHPVRITGQDSQRGTFTHRHAVQHDTQTGAESFPLQKLSPTQAKVEIVNSPLNESGVLGFEYGYSLDVPDGLVVWEAQFGDFANCAQVIIDQFICSAESKWNRVSGITMLLPHGYEGQGPEHSSARLERFLQLCAEDNVQVCQPTTPAQIYHLLRRQVLRKWRKPLIVMSPKSLLRHPEAVSTFDEIENGAFQRVIADAGVTDAKKVKRVCLCSGKIYYELNERRKAEKRDDVAFVRVEELYPFPEAQLAKTIAAYACAVEVVWVQDEPLNQGAWSFIHLQFPGRIGDLPLHGLGRRPSASPATGSNKAHKLEQERLLNMVFGSTDQDPENGVAVQCSLFADMLPKAGAKAAEKVQPAPSTPKLAKAGAKK